MDRETLVKNIRAGMKERGWSGRRLSDEAGLNESAVKNIFNERSNFPRVDTIYKIAIALGTTVGELIGEPGSRLSPADAELLRDINRMTPENRERFMQIAAAWAAPRDTNKPTENKPDGRRSTDARRME